LIWYWLVVSEDGEQGGYGDGDEVEGSNSGVVSAAAMPCAFASKTNSCGSQYVTEPSDISMIARVIQSIIDPSPMAHRLIFVHPWNVAGSPHDL
jgi:hypothetical protein